MNVLNLKGDDDELTDDSDVNVAPGSEAASSMALHSVKMSLETRSELLAKWLECFLCSGVSVCDFVRKVNYH